MAEQMTLKDFKDKICDNICRCLKSSDSMVLSFDFYGFEITLMRKNMEDTVDKIYVDHKCVFDRSSFEEPWLINNDYLSSCVLCETLNPLQLNGTIELITPKLKDNYYLFKNIGTDPSREYDRWNDTWEFNCDLPPGPMDYER